MTFLKLNFKSTPRNITIPFKHWEYNDALTDGAIEEIINC